ncbi:MAG: 4Fe-4S dicluster domain-containing protein [Desulfitobacterium hafniense]|nr:4Fe-4S dicluster domain-containing protein [Desulfitobacterium hafniense]
MSENISRRTFFKRSTAAGALGVLMATGLGKTAKAQDTNSTKNIGSVIDLTKCDGCQNEPIPLCVSACETDSKSHFPEPQKPLKPYWPQKFFEDWSEKRNIKNRLTPYNWTFVDKVTVEHNGQREEISVPRRCMHCDNPTCQKLCPFSAIDKKPSGAVSIDPDVCFGGAKCRDVCPWQIPQRQAGVGLYMKLAPDLAGGGVMFKCDMCSDLLAAGKQPACQTACPKGAIKFGPKVEIKKYAYERAKEVNGYVYGDKENGGTSTFYISKVPFEKIHQAIINDKKANKDDKPGRPGMPVGVENYLDSTNGLFLSALIAPIAGAAAAGFTAYRTLKGEKKDE